MVAEDSWADGVADHLYANVGTYSLIGIFLSFILIDKGKWPAEYQTNLSYALLGLFGVFITIAILTQITKRVAQVNTGARRELSQRIRELSEEETKRTTTFARKAEICDEKKELYGEIEQVNNRDMAKMILTGSAAILAFLVLQPFKEFFVQEWVWLPIMILQVLFWYSTFKIVHLLLLFYDSQTT
ncbi:TPA: hypothetical protein HA251_00860 [Candidatus Woesearchaeota archaeon]|nr:hypothetical protein [Candidatus Woesearchaeota archaeon]